MDRTVGTKVTAQAPNRLGVQPFGLPQSRIAPSGPIASTSGQDQRNHNPLRKIAFYAGLGLLFLHLSLLSELLLYTTHINFYLLYLVGPPAILGALLTGGLKRTFQHKASIFWAAYFAWMILAVPFSSWRSDSAKLIFIYGRVDFAMLFVVGGLAVNWKEIRMIFYTIALAAVANLVAAKVFMKLDPEGRISLEASGNIGNSNDLGAHLLLVTPFLIFVILDRRRNAFLRAFLLTLVGYCSWVVLGTASRGCMMAMAAMFLFTLWRASPTQRIAGFMLGALLVVVIPFFLSSNVIARLGSLFAEEQISSAADRDLYNEAQESTESRRYLLKQSLLFTIQHPVFGVGPGQFPNFEGRMRREEGKRGQWKVTHNFLTQVSSECGIPAVLFVVLSLGSAILLVNRTYVRARKKGFFDIANACFCYQLAMVGYLGSVIFLAHAYKFYLPVMVGLAVAMCMVANQQMSAGETSGLATATSGLAIAPTGPFGIRRPIASVEI